MNPTASTRRNRFQNLQTLLKTICLRRTRELLNLPEPIRQTRRLPLSPSEQRDYYDLSQQCKREINMAVSGHKKSKINAIMLESLLKLRLFCNNGNTNAVLYSGEMGLPEDPDEALTYLQQHERNICDCCSRMIYFISDVVEADNGIFISCRQARHLICHGCRAYYNARGDCRSCASGNESTLPVIASTSDVPRRQSENSGTLNPDQYPSKLLALLSDIRANATQKRCLLLGLHFKHTLLTNYSNCLASSFLAGRRHLSSFANFSVIMKYHTT
jgi:SWI/SNF-related matrix-associated actin-dependent regulator of chromatin subfamily A3